MDLIVNLSGTVSAIYAEAIDLATLGTLNVRRASHVEPDEHGGWSTDLAPVGGPVLGPFPYRSAALTAEVAWLQLHWLTPPA